MAGDRRGDMIEPVAQRQRGPDFGQFCGKIAEQPGDVGLAERRGGRADQHRGRPEALDVEPEPGELKRGLLEPVAIGFVHLDHVGEQEGLARDAVTLRRRAHPFEHEPLVRGVLIDDHQPILGFGDDIGRGDLAARNPEREGRNRRGGGLGARCGRKIAAKTQPFLGHPRESGGPAGGVRPGRKGKRWVSAFAGLTCKRIAPLNWRRRLNMRGAPVAGLVERGAEAPDDQPAHRARIAEADFGLGGMDVDVDLAGGHVDEQRRHRMAIARQQIAIRRAQ